MAVPTLIDLVVSGTSVALRYSEALSTTLPSFNRFIIKVNGKRVYATGPATLSADGTTILLKLAGPVAVGAKVTLAYGSVNGAEKPGFGDIQSRATAQKASFLRDTAATNLTLAPTLAISSSASTLKAGETATITFSFSEVPSGFTAADIATSGGSLSGLTVSADPKVYTATFTPTAGSSGTASIAVASGSYTDTAGNSGAGGSSAPISFDSLAPTLAISSDKGTLKAGETATILFSFSEIPSGFDASDITTSGGSLSALSSTADPQVFSALFTPTASSSGTASIAVASGSYADAAGNSGAGGSSAPISFDTLAPTLAISSDKGTLKADETATISFSFSEVPSGFTASDINTSGGSLSGLAVSSDPKIYTATFTPTAGSSGTASIAVAAGLYSDGTGNSSSLNAELSITITSATPVLTPAAPAITALENDTGTPDDFLTAARRLVLLGTSEAGTSVELFRDGSSLGSTIAGESGGWRFVSPTGDLPDGSYGFTAIATRPGAPAASPSLPVRIIQVDGSAPAEPTASLATSSNTGILGDSITSVPRVTLVGTGEAGAILQIDGTDRRVLIGADGRFALHDLALSEGSNVLSVRVTDAAGNSTASALTLQRTTPDPGSDPVLAWNQTALQTIQADAAQPAFATRALAMESIAVLDTLAAIDGTAAYLVGLQAPDGIPAVAAVAAAAHQVLLHLFPNQKARLDARLAVDLASVAAGSARDGAVAFGRSVADAVIALREHDGWDAFLTAVGGTAPGQWRPTAPSFELAQTPQWASLTPFSLTSGNQFRPDAPPALTSEAYTADFQQTRSLGSATSSTRTPEQTAIARFWADGGGTHTPPGHWNDIANDLAASGNILLGSAARLLAILNVALADSSIAAWDAKYTYDAWRPITAIREADLDGNPDTTADSTWQPLLVTPNHPEYVSGHSTYSAAAATVLTELLGSIPFTTDSISLPGVNRSFADFRAAADEAGRSRIYAGIHFDFSNKAGQGIGDAVAHWVLNGFSSDKDTRAPFVLLEQQGDVVLSLAPVLEGYALDNFTGLSGVDIRLDGGAHQNVAVDGRGRFSVNLAALYGSLSEGLHTLSLSATDAAGNTGTAPEYRFTIDSTAPTILLSSLAEGDQLAAGARLSGSASGTGSSLQGLSYRFDGGVERSLTFDPLSGAFDEALSLRTISPGDHQLTLTATDASGNVTTSQIGLSLPTAIPFAIEKVSPTNGATEVGVTFRPQVIFTRPVDPSSLTSSSFYATDAAGHRLPGVVVVSPLGTSAWLFLDQAMPGANAIDLHLDGSLIKASGDAALLDADGDGSPGGSWNSQFSTVSRTPVPGTTISGFVIGPGADLKPMTFDDFRVGPDGAAHTDDDVFLERLAGVKVYILGLENGAVYTDAQGRFSINDVPAGVVKVAVDGRTATNAPSGAFFPEMVMDVTIRPGQDNTIMGTMGSSAEQQENLNRGEIYLPRLSTSILTTIAADQPTVVGTPVEGAPNLLEAERNRIQLLVQPGSVIGENGQPLANAKVGIATVPPELVRDMLPPGILQHTFDLTIQAPGAAVFSTPLQLTLPNVFNAAPGTKLNLLSFDHTTGRLVIDGTGTVSQDGQFVVTDPDSGVTRPGWHGMTPPGGNGCDGGPPLQPQDLDPTGVEETLAPETLPLYSHNGEGGIRFTREWTAPAALPDSPPTPGTANLDCPPPAADPPGKEQPWIQVTIDVDETLEKFAKKAGNLDLVDQTFMLRAGTGATRGFAFSMKTFSEMFGSDLLNSNQLDKDKLYGSKIHIEVLEQKADGSQATTKQDVYVSRIIDAADDNHTDATLEFAQTLNDGAGKQLRVLPVEYIGLRPDVKISGGQHFYNSNSINELWFDPVASGQQSDSLQVSFTSAGGGMAGSLSLKGKGVDPEKFWFDPSSWEAQLLEVVNNTGGKYGFANATQKALIDTPAERTALLDVIRSQTQKLYDDAGLNGIQSSASGGVGVNSITFLDGTAKINYNPPGVISGAALGGATSAFAKADIDFDKIIDLYTNRNNYNKQELAFRAAQVINNISGGPIEFYLGNFFAFSNLFDTDLKLKFSLGHNGAHEIGHNIGLTHTKEGSTLLIAGEADDVMAQGLYSTDTQKFNKSKAPATVALHNSWTPQLVLDALSIYNEANTTVAGYITGLNNYVGLTNSIGSDGAVDVGHEWFVPVNRPALEILHSDGSAVFDTLAFDTTLADGTGAAAASITLTLLSYGSQPVLLDDLSTTGNGFRLQAPPGRITLAPGQKVDVTLSFDPKVAGAATSALKFRSNVEGVTDIIELTGFGQAVGPTLTIDFLDGNNFGGQELSAVDILKRPVRLRNIGNQKLTINDINLDNSAFSLYGLPTDLATSPVQLDFDQSFDFEVGYNASVKGLQRAGLNVLSNDSGNLATAKALVGSGYQGRPFFDWGNDYVAVDIGGQTLRSRSNTLGQFEFFLPAESNYSITIFDPTSQLVAQGSGVTPVSGRGANLASGLIFRPSAAVDSDGDGLPDDIEHAIGTSSLKRDSNSDGLSDFDAVQNGKDPLGDFRLPIGVVGSLALPGEVRDLALVSGLPALSGLTALIALGSSGLAIVDLSTPLNPRLLATLDLPGVSGAIAYDSQTRRAVLAANDRLLIVDLGNPVTPVLRESISGAASQVETLDGIAYVASGSLIRSFDLLTAEDYGNISIGASISGLAREGNFLYVLTSSGQLNVLEINGQLLLSRGSSSLPGGVAYSTERKLYAADGVLYVPVDNGFTGGYATFDVSNSSTPILLSGPDITSIGGTAIALTGSGQGVIVGRPGGVFGNTVLDLLDTRDPANTGANTTRVVLAANPIDVAFASGFAYVLTSGPTSSLQVVNVIPPDLNGVAPTCTIDTTGIDIDPATPGLQVQEGTTLSLRTTIRDDVLVDRVEVLVNGVVTSADPTYPFDLRAVLPSIANAGGTTATVRVRVTDSGGNVGLSDPLALTLTPDVVAPTIIDRNVVEGDLVGRSFRTFRFTFSEPVLLTAAADEVFRLVPPPGFSAPTTSVVFRDNGRVIQLSVDLLASGDGYRLEFDTSKVRDGAGNLLGSAVEITHFDVSAYDNMFFGTSGPDYLTGGEGRDLLSGAPRTNPETDTGSDNLYGLAGDDDLYGHGGYDYLDGGAGNDRLDVGADGGYANGGAGNDLLLGGDGNDNLNGGGDLDSFYGGDGNDYLSDGDQPIEDPIYNPDNGHWYQFVQAYGSWSQAREASALRRLGPLSGYLATITSAEEQAFIDTAFSSGGYPSLYNTWIGAGDAETPGTWQWVTGPEAGTTISIEGGNPTGVYNNWQLGQPDGSGPLADSVLLVPNYSFGASTNLLSDSINESIQLGGEGNVSSRYKWYATNGDASYAGYGYLVEYGTPADSTLLQAPGDLFDAGAGDDSINSRGGNDSIDGGDGTDQLDLNLTMFSQAVILDLSDPTTPATLSTGGTVVNVESFSITSGRGNDSIRTGAGSDNLYGGDGNDSLYGGAGYDYLYGEAGNDLLDLGNGDGYGSGGHADGGAGNDQLLGGDGSDNLRGGGGLDSLYGGAGNDYLSDADQSFEDPVYNPDNGHWYQYVQSYGSWSQARDAAALSQLATLGGYLVTITSAAEQTFINTAFANNYYTWIGASDADTQGSWTWATGPETGLIFTIEGAPPTGAYNNWQSGQPGNSGPSANSGAMLGSYSNNGWYAFDGAYNNLSGFIIEYGAPDDSTLLQPPGDLLDAGAGDDSINSRGGNDSIDGGDGTDRLDLNLTMLSQAVILDLSDPTATATLSTGGTVVNVESFSITSGRGNDSIRTGAGSDNLYGGDGNDSLYGGAGYDYLYGEAGNDLLNLGDGDGFADGGADNDQLLGGDGYNTLQGGGGDDLINGGLNSDYLIGGDGSDTFSYQNANEGGDFITDFNGSYDRIQVSAAGFGGGLVAGIDLLASGRYIENSTGLATSAAGIGQFIYLASSNQLYWDGDGAGGMSASLQSTLYYAVNWSASGLQVV
jgi:Ca2+-binding RTX toxin-like protein